MSSVQIFSPRTKHISSYHTYSISPTAILERSSITLINSNAIATAQTAVSPIKTNKAIHLNTTPSPQQHNKFVFPTTNTHQINSKKPQKQSKSHKNKSKHTVKQSQTETKKSSALILYCSPNTIDMLSFRGYKKQKTLAPSLQGQVFIASKTSSHRDSLLVYGYIRQILSDTDIANIFHICYEYIQNEQTVVIKSANKKLHRKRISITNNGMSFGVKEDIVKEACLMKMFQRKNAPKSIIKYFDFFEDKDNYYLVMEHGGKALFEFVVECHQLISQGKLSLQEWKKAVRFIFAKMVRVINWMHNVVRCCNLDVSLENVVMGKDTYVDETTGQIKNLEIRFIDFGLTERFQKSNTNFICDKFVGKTGYKAPKVFSMKNFCANKADVWSLGVCLWCMSIGAPLYKMPVVQDQGFRILKDKKLLSMLQNWARLNYIGKNQYDLLMKMLNMNEDERYCITDVMKHQWIRSYFHSKPKTIHRKFSIRTIKNDTIALHENMNMNERKPICRTPSIKESETFQFKLDEFCAEVDLSNT